MTIFITLLIIYVLGVVIFFIKEQRGNYGAMSFKDMIYLSLAWPLLLLLVIFGWLLHIAGFRIH